MDHTHNEAEACTNCHPHGEGFQPVITVPFPHDAQACNTCHTAEPDYAAAITNTACMSCHDGTPAVLVDRHYSSTYNDPTTSQPMDLECVECHNPMYPQTNLAFIRDTLRGNTVVFTAYTGTNSFADGDTTYDGVCEVCHTQTSHHQNDGSAPQQSHNDGQDCTTACHPHPDGFNPTGGDCRGCHSSAQGAAREVISEFQGAGGIGHMKFDVSTADNPTLEATCTQCHGEIPAPMDGTFDVPTWMAGSSAVGSEAFCLECHDGAPTQPFSAGGDTNDPADISTPWTSGTDKFNHSAEATCADCHGDGAGINTYHGGSTPGLLLEASQYNTCVTANCHGTGGTINMATELSGSGGKHPIDGAVTPFSTVMQADSTGVLFVDGWTKDSVTLCSDCHSTNGGGPSGPHGSSYGYILKGADTSINSVTSGRGYGNPKNSAATGVEQRQNFCVNCHASDVYGFSSTATFPTNASLGTSGPGHYANSGGPRLRDRCMGNDGENGREGVTGGPTGLRVSCTGCHGGGVWNYGTHSSSVPVTPSWAGTGFMNGNSWSQRPDTNNCYADTGGGNGWSTCNEGQHN